MNLYPYVVTFLGAVALTLFLIARDRKGSVKTFARMILAKTIPRRGASP